MASGRTDPEAFAPTVEATPTGEDADKKPATATGLASAKYRLEGKRDGSIQRARDTHLDRDVVLAFETDAAAIERETAALARIAHANVIVVYETGELAGEKFVAREYVGGSTARAWLAAAPRTAAEVVAMFCAAGDGLAAAHAAGVVHGNVNADAIVVGDDGRPRLAGFERATLSTDSSARDTDRRALATAIADALENVRGVPGRLQAALDRDWPSVAALVAELRRDPGQRRRWIAAGVGGAAVIAGAIALTLSMRGGPTPCNDDDAAIASVWSPARADAIAKTFESSGGKLVWADLRPRLDSYAGQWRAGRHDACKATRIDHSQPEAILDRRMMCIDRARAQLDSVVAALAAGDRAAVGNAPQAVALLPDLSRCADVNAIASEAAPPADAAARAKIEQSIRQVADARTTIVWGAKDGAKTAESVLAGAVATGWPPAIADAKLLRGQLLLDAQDVEKGRTALEDSAQYALANHLDEVAAFSMAELGLNLATAGRSADAEHWVSLAHSIWSHLGEPPLLGELVLRGEAKLAMDASKFDDGIAAEKHAIELARRVQGETPSDHYNLADAYEQKADFENAAKEIETGRAAAIAKFGPQHPSVAEFDYKGAEIEMYRTNYTAAIDLAKRSIAINEAWYGTDDVHLVDALEILGSSYERANRSDEAHAPLDRALAILHAHSPDASEITTIEEIYGDMEGRLEHWDAAIEHDTRALESLEARYGKESTYIMFPLVNRSIAQRHGKHFEESAAGLQRAVDIGRKTVGPGAAETINAGNELSYSLIAVGRVNDAVALLEANVALVEKDSTNVPLMITAEAHQAYADALWRSGGDHAKARALSQKGRDQYAAAGPDFENERKGCEAWLASHK